MEREDREPVTRGRVRVFDSQGEEYRHAFQAFLDHTDQKRNARRWVQTLIDTLPSREVFIDAGAGNGEVAAGLASSFRRIIAVEPNPHLHEALRRAVPDASIISAPILEAEPEVPADLVLCSHTLYYIDPRRWLEHLERLVSWMAPDGVTVVVLQHRNTTCMDMLERFHGRRYDLAGLAEAFRVRHDTHYDSRIDMDEAHVETRDLGTLRTIAEFMLNLFPIIDPPALADLEAYIQAHFATANGQYRFTCHQDFLQIRRRT